MNVGNIPWHLQPLRTQAEVAEIMTARGDRLTRTRVFQIEQRALAKLSRDPVLRELYEALDCRDDRLEQVRGPRVRRLDAEADVA